MFKKNINKNLKFSIYLVITIIITLCFSISIQSLLAAWTYPTASPPSGNVSGLLNEGINDQTKLGGLTIGGAFKADSIDNTLVVDAANNRVGIGTCGPSEKLEVDGNVKANAFFYSSDRRLKKDIKPISNALDKILQLEGVFFKWKDNDNDEKNNLGLIAQDVEKIFPELVSTSEITGLKSVQYGNLVAPLVDAIKEQQAQAEEQQKQINELKEEIKKLKE